MRATPNVSQAPMQSLISHFQISFVVASFPRYQNKLRAAIFTSELDFFLSYETSRIREVCQNVALNLSLTNPSSKSKNNWYLRPKLTKNDFLCKKFDVFSMLTFDIFLNSVHFLDWNDLQLQLDIIKLPISITKSPKSQENNVNMSFLGA